MDFLNFFATTLDIVHIFDYDTPIMPVYVDIRLVLAVVIPIVVALLGANAGLVVFIIKGLARRYDPLITEVAELKQDSVRSEERLRAANARQRDMIELMDAKLESLIVRHGMLERQHTEARKLDAERDAERRRLDEERDAERRKLDEKMDAERRKLDAERDAERRRLDAERREMDNERRKTEAEMDAQRRKLDDQRDAERQRYLAVMQRQHAEIQRDISELQEGLREIKARIDDDE